MVPRERIADNHPRRGSGQDTGYGNATLIGAHVEDIDWSQDKVNSISSLSGRLVVEDTSVGAARAVQVRPGSAPKVQISALMDLLDLHLSEVACGKKVAPDRVVLRVPDLTTEARGALGTIIDALSPGIEVEVMEPVDPSPAPGDETCWSTTTVGWDATDETEYPGWADLLRHPRVLPPLVADIATTADLPSLRAYPMLSTKNGWSLRIEGLEVGRATAKSATLNVGKDGKTGNQSMKRKAWIHATGRHTKYATTSAADAAQVISTFAKHWHDLGTANVAHDEHALESRILRGEATVSIGGEPLSLIREDDVVSWGSQFPTKWGPGGKARYLDALLRHGSTPWAVEMKVQGAAGVGQYYRHAVAQAVLYRDFIRRATPLHFWFDELGLDAADCRAAVVVPEMTHAMHAKWRDRVIRLCEALDVVFVEIDPQHAVLH